MSIRQEYSVATIGDFVGRELGVSNWVVVDQARINAFAECTGDRQWIHVDVERAKRESPFGGTIAHGYLTLSLLAGLRDRDRHHSQGRFGGPQLRSGQGALHDAGQGRCACA